MANTLTTIDMVAREALRIAHENLTFLGTIDQSYDSSFAKSGGKIGDTLRVRDPNQYVRRKGSRVMDVQDQDESTQNVVVATQDGVDMKFNSAELELSIDNFSQRYIEPAVKVLVAGIEGDVLEDITLDLHQTTGTAGTVVGSSSGDISAITVARGKLNQQLAPKGNRSVQFDSITMGEIVNGNKGLFNPQSDASKAFREGFYGRNAMADWFENEKTPTHTIATEADVAWTVNDSTRLAAYTDAVGLSVLNFDAMGTTNASSAGTVFTIDTLFDCHPETKAKYANLKQFRIVTAAQAGNAGDVTFTPTIRTGGAKQNCFISGGSASIADLEDNIVLPFGATGASLRQNIMYSRDFATFVTADLPIMDDAIRCVRRVQDSLSIRCWQGSDIKNDELLLRLDILYGWKLLREEWGVRISN